jgi:hypothetical protein
VATRRASPPTKRVGQQLEPLVLVNGRELIGDGDEVGELGQRERGDVVARRIL